MEFLVGSMPVPYAPDLPDVQSFDGRGGRLTRSRERALYKRRINALEEQLGIYRTLLSDSRTLEKKNLELVKELRAEVHQSLLREKSKDKQIKDLVAGYNRLKVNSRGPSEPSSKAKKWTPAKKAEHAQIQATRLAEKAEKRIVQTSKRRVRREAEEYAQIRGSRKPGGACVVSHTPVKRVWYETVTDRTETPLPEEEREAILRRASSKLKEAEKQKARSLNPKKLEQVEDKIPTAGKSKLQAAHSSTSGANWRKREKVKDLELEIEHLRSCRKRNIAKYPEADHIMECETGDCLGMSVEDFLKLEADLKKKRLQAMESGAMHK